MAPSHPAQLHASSVKAELLSPAPGLRRSSSASTVSWQTDSSLPSPTTPITEDESDYMHQPGPLMGELEGCESFSAHSIAPNLLSLDQEHANRVQLLHQEQYVASKDVDSIVEQPPATHMHAHILRDQDSSLFETPQANRRHSVYDMSASTDSSSAFCSSPVHQRYLQPRDFNINSSPVSLTSSSTEGDVERIFSDSRFGFEDPSDCKVFEFTQPYGSRENDTNPRDAAMTALQCVIPGQTTTYADMDSEGIPPSSPPPTSHISLPAYSSSGRVHASRSRYTTPTRQRRAARGPSSDYPLVVSSTDKPHECSMDGCKRRFKRQEHLRRHEKTHTGERPYECDIRGCGKWFSRTDNLRYHKKTHTKQGGRNPFIPGLVVQ